MVAPTNRIVHKFQTRRKSISENSQRAPIKRDPSKTAAMRIPARSECDCHPQKSKPAASNPVGVFMSATSPPYPKFLNFAARLNLFRCGQVAGRQIALAARPGGLGQLGWSLVAAG